MNDIVSKTNPACTVNLLAIASRATYRVKQGDIIDPTVKDYHQTLIDIASYDYAITKSVTPKSNKGSGLSPLTALCLEPADKNKPIIIAFRGTNSSEDLVSDLHLSIAGVVEQQFRQSAFNFYSEVKAQNPNREIVLTGHSLGGHLAQYVFARAYDEDKALVHSELLQARTFNTAPITTTHDSVLKKYNLEHLVVNYSVFNDIVSKLEGIGQHYFGNNFSFYSNHNAYEAHPMGAILEALPADIKNLAVGTSENTVTKNLLIEQIYGVLYSYECRVNNQYFSSFRAGAINLKHMQNDLPGIVALINEDNYDKAHEALSNLQGKLQGQFSTNILEVLKNSTQATKGMHPQGNTEQQQWKAEINKLRTVSEVNQPNHSLLKPTN